MIPADQQTSRGDRCPSKHLSPLVYALLLAVLAGCASEPPQENTGENGSNRQEQIKHETGDEAITNAVKQAISGSPELASEEIIVETTGGVVVLSGFVSSIIVMEKAVSLAKGVRGVKEVKDVMRLKWQY